MSYSGMMRLDSEKPEWLRVVEACVEEAKRCQPDGEFAGRWVYQQLGVWSPNLNLKSLVSYGILVHTDSTRGSKRAYYRVADLEGTQTALQELLGGRVAE